MANEPSVTGAVRPKDTKGTSMAKILCVLYADPAEGYPTSYPRDDLPHVEKYPDGQSLPRLDRSISSPDSCSVACQVS